MVAHMHVAINMWIRCMHGGTWSWTLPTFLYPIGFGTSATSQPLEDITTEQASSDHRSDTLGVEGIHITLHACGQTSKYPPVSDHYTTRVITQEVVRAS